MTKVKCLQRILNSLAGKNVSAPEDDTVCDLLHKIGDVVGVSTKKEDISSKFVGTVNDSLFTGTCTPKVIKSGVCYEMSVSISITAKEACTALGKVASVSLPDEAKLVGVQYVATYRALQKTSGTTYTFGHAGLIHPGTNDSRDIHVLDSVSMDAGDTLMFDARFLFIA
ncbi:MAG: hypothetical protein MJ000_11695 [Bacteroidales bacterium]|nr:hypothetical protein [Bacteroidales bacterium]